jgi:hypothetical protein
MRLSDAIRLGAMMKPQAFKGLFRDGGSCALGAALDAIGCGLDDGFRDQLALFPTTIGIGRVTCPQCGRFGWIDAVVVHLNDDHRWTREAIADFVEPLERRAESAAVDASDPHVADPGTLTTRA